MLQGAQFNFTAGQIFAMFGISMFKLASYVVIGTHFVVVVIVTVTYLWNHVNIHVLF